MATESSAKENVATISVDNVEITERDTSAPGFATVPLDGEPKLIDAPGKKKKVPRKILHFSDGILEEYSTDEEEEEKEEEKTEVINPRTLAWMPWFWYWMAVSAKRTLAAADFCGERLAWTFGITSPKYQYAIDEFNRMKEEDKEEQEREQRELEAERMRKLQRMSDMEGGGEEETSKGGAVNPAYSHPDLHAASEAHVHKF